MGFYIGGKVGPIGWSQSLSTQRSRRHTPRPDDAKTGVRALAMMVSLIAGIVVGHWLAGDDGGVWGLLVVIATWIGAAIAAVIREVIRPV